MSETYLVKRYNLFSHAGDEIIVRGLSKEQAEIVAQRLEALEKGLGGIVYRVLPE